MASTTIHRWQYAFLLGLATLIVASVLVFGVSSFTALVGAVAIAAGIINAFAGPANRPDTSGNWLLSTLKAFLNVGKFLKTATILIWLTTAVIGSLGVYEGVRAYKESKKITVEGLVLTAKGDPADKAVVKLFLSHGDLQVVADKGKFVFPKVDVSSEPSKTVKIQARSGTKQAELLVDISAGSPQGLVIQLPPGDPPFRVSYFVLKRHAIDYLLQGKVDKEWQQKLAGQPYIVPNSVYKTLSSLAKSFPENVGGDSVSFKEEDASKHTLNEKSGDAQPYNIKTVFVGSSEGGIIYLNSQLAFTYLNTLADSNEHWKLFINPSVHKLPDALVLRRPANRNDLTNLTQSSIGKFYSLVTRENMPPDFGYVDLYFESLECGGGGPMFAATRFIGRELSLRIAVVENITNEPINLGSFALKENSSERIRSRADEKAFLGKIPQRQDVLFPFGILKPGERILIPLEMTLGFPKDDVPSVTDETLPSRSPRLIEQIERARQLDFPMYDSTSSSNRVDVHVETKDIESILASTNSTTSFDNEYLYGSSVEIESVEIDGENFPFRQFDPNKILIYQTEIGGSCPYVYTYSLEKHDWINQGVILYDRNGLSRKAIDHKALSTFSGRILIREKEAEESFIDSVYVTAISPDGRETKLYPRIRTLRYDDGRYLILRTGQQVIIDFDVPKALTGNRFVLSASGYYITQY